MVLGSIRFCRTRKGISRLTISRHGLSDTRAQAPFGSTNVTMRILPNCDLCDNGAVLTVGKRGYVRFTPRSGHTPRRRQRPLSAETEGQRPYRSMA